jgi:hypothetical protein
MVREFVAKTATVDEYLDARTLRPINSALIDPVSLTEATVKFGNITDFLVWTEIRYVRSDGNYETVRVNNDQSEAFCPNIRRGAKFQIRCAYTPPATDMVLVTEWKDYSAFMLKYDRRDWVVATRNQIGGWWTDGLGSQNIWYGGHPMLVLDDDLGSSWHSNTDAHYPHVLIIDMKESREVSRILGVGAGDYWNDVRIYLTDELPVPGYVSHNVDWDSGDREGAYDAWLAHIMNLIPSSENLPVPSWGTPIAQAIIQFESTFSFTLAETRWGQYLIVMLPDKGGSDYCAVSTIEVFVD